MADICACCGKKIPFLDVDFDFVEIEKVDYRLCGKCRNKINAYNNGNISVCAEGTQEKVSEASQAILDGSLRPEFRILHRVNQRGSYTGKPGGHQNRGGSPEKGIGILQ